MIPDFTTIQIADTADHLKIYWPLKRNWFLFGLFSLALLVWLIMLIGMAIYLIRDVMTAGERFTFVFSIMLLIWLYVWFRFGGILWTRWQYYLADREVLFIEKTRLIIRRPVSLLGITHAYDMDFVSPFYYSDKHNCPAFDYGYQHVYFGQNLVKDEAGSLVTMLNSRFFPDSEDE